MPGDLRELFFKQGQVLSGRLIEKLSLRVVPHRIIPNQAYVTGKRVNVAIHTLRHVLLYGAQIHGLLDNCEIVGNAQLHRVNRLVE